MCDPKQFFLEKYQYGYQKNAEFYADFKFVDADINKCPKKKLKPKNYANFCNLKMQMRTNCTFSNIMQKVKSYFFANIYHYRVIPIESPKKVYN